MDADAKTEAVALSLALAKDRIMLGEPVVLDYRISNRGTMAVLVYLGKEHDAWISLDLADEAGRSAPVRPDPRVLQGGISSPGARIAPGQHYKDALVVTRGLGITHTGKYRLSVKTHLPYISAPSRDSSDTPAAGFPAKHWSETTETVLVWEDVFSLFVTEPDPAGLRAVAEALRQEAVMSKDHSRRIALVRALLSMPEVYALESWKVLADDPRGTRDTLINELARVMSPQSADILAQLWRPNPGPLLVADQPAVMLDSMYRAGDTALKRHIEKIFARYGKAISSHPLFFPG